MTVRARSSQSVAVSFTPPKVKDASTYPVYSGYIEIASTTETQRVSYVGVAAALKDKEVLDNTSQFFNFSIPAFIDNAGDPQVNASYTLKGDDQPVLLYRLAFGSPLVRLDLVAASFSLPAHNHKRSFLSWAWWWGSNWNSFGSVKTLGALQELDYTPRSADAAVCYLELPSSCAIAYCAFRMPLTTAGTNISSMVHSPTARLSRTARTRSSFVLCASLATRTLLQTTIPGSALTSTLSVRNDLLYLISH